MGRPPPDWLTESDVARIADGYCPDCRHRGFVLGPRGGAAINIECGGCGARFNVAQAPASHRVVMAQRIDREDEGGSSWQ